MALEFRLYFRLFFISPLSLCSSRPLPKLLYKHFALGTHFSSIERAFAGRFSQQKRFLLSLSLVFMRRGTEREIVEALKVITRRLRDAKIKWVLVGSTSLALQGVDVSPKDIDILTDKDGAFEINKLLKEYEVKSVQFKTSDLFESFF